MVIIGIDPHKRTHTASALEPGTHRVLATLQIEATLAGYRGLLRWAVLNDALVEDVAAGSRHRPR